VDKISHFNYQQMAWTQQAYGEETSPITYQVMPSSSSKWIIGSNIRYWSLTCYSSLTTFNRAISLECLLRILFTRPLKVWRIQTHWFPLVLGLPNLGIRLLILLDNILIVSTVLTRFRKTTPRLTSPLTVHLPFPQLGNYLL